MALEYSICQCERLKSNFALCLPLIAGHDLSLIRYLAPELQKHPLITLIIGDPSNRNEFWREKGERGTFAYIRFNYKNYEEFLKTYEETKEIYAEYAREVNKIKQPSFINSYFLKNVMPSSSSFPAMSILAIPITSKIAEELDKQIVIPPKEPLSIKVSGNSERVVFDSSFDPYAFDAWWNEHRNQSPSQAS
jgi:hypothetical protein